MIRSGLVGPKPRPRGVGDGEQVNSPAPLGDRLSVRGDATGQGSRPTGQGRCRLVARGWGKHPQQREGTAKGGLRPDPSPWVPLSPRKAPARGGQASVPQTDTGRRGEPSSGARVSLCQGIRQLDPVTSGDGGPQ